MHHLHLSRKLDESGFAERLDYLLFSIVGDEEVFFVDVRKYHDPEKLLWVRQDLLNIVHSNWPGLTYTRALHGVIGSTITDVEKRELRRKNANHIPGLGGHAIAPLGGGTMSDGSSAWCRAWGNKLLHEVEQHESYFYSLYSQPAELVSCPIN